ncbi:MAG: nucleoside-diphosphate kinase [Varibaculum sp.]|nr:nucleoside-diphosphate kinase [Varibaculum sp.]
MADKRLIDFDKEHSLVLIKPDGVRRKLVGEVIRRIEAKGYDIVAMKSLLADEEMVRRHYEEHVNKHYFASLLKYMTDGPVVVIIVEGERVVEGMRALVGATNPTLAAAGTIRGDFGRDWGTGLLENIIHCSDSPIAAEREKLIWFPNLES